MTLWGSTLFNSWMRRDLCVCLYCLIFVDLHQAPFFFAQAILGIFFPFDFQLTMTWNWNAWLNISFWIFIKKKDEYLMFAEVTL